MADGMADRMADVVADCPGPRPVRGSRVLRAVVQGQSLAIAALSAGIDMSGVAPMYSSAHRRLGRYRSSRAMIQRKRFAVTALSSRVLVGRVALVPG